MKQVRSFQTSDGKLFTESQREDAEQHELVIKIRGILQTYGRNGTLSATDVAMVIAQNQDEVFETLGAYRRTMASVKAAKTQRAGK
jgi:hypothetical protein